jgi:hypothetical protein
MGEDHALGARFCGRHEIASGAGRANSVVVGVVEICAGFFGVRTGVRPETALQQRRKRKHKLSESEEENRRSPECSWKHFRSWHEIHTRLSVASFPLRRQLTAAAEFATAYSM